jgi:sulfonate transport system permease protein
MRQFAIFPHLTRQTAAINVVRRSASWLLFICAWQAVSPITNNWALPGPWEIATQVVTDWQVLLPHLVATLGNALIGLAAGLSIGLLLGIGFYKSRTIEMLGYGPSLVLYAMPIIAMAPLLALLLPNGTVPSVFATITIFFPMALTVRRALADINESKRRLFSSYGASAWARLLYLEFPSALPAMLAGVQALIPWAFLGAMLGEFVGGRWGLGVLMLGTLGRGEPVRLWAVAAVATGLSAVGFGFMGLVRTSIEKRLGAGSEIGEAGSVVDPVDFLHLLVGLISVAIVWDLFAQLSSVSAPLVLSPIEVVTRLISDPTSTAELIHAMWTTAPMALLSLGVGVGVAAIWAVVGRIWPAFGTILTAATLVTQSVPLLALAPLLVLSLGRGALVTVVITVLAIVFPCYTAILQRLETVPKELVSLSIFYSRRRTRRLWYIELPWAVYGVFTAIRIAAPRALLGVMLAEYLATGQGLGFLMATARGRIDFTIIWAGIALTALFSLTLYYLAGLVERRYSRLLS